MDTIRRFKELIKEKKDAEQFNKKFDSVYERCAYGITGFSFVLAYRDNQLFSRPYEILVLDDEDINYLYKKYVSTDSLLNEMNEKIKEIKKQYGQESV